MIAERHFKNEDVIKEKIVDGYKRGVCDKNGKPLLKLTSCFVATEKYRNNYDKIDWSDNG